MEGLSPVYPFLVMRAARLFFRIIDLFTVLIFRWSFFNGWMKEKERSEKEYEFGAHIVNIVGRGAYSHISIHDLVCKDFQ